jgi:hypothetical protein
MTSVQKVRNRRNNRRKQKNWNSYVDREMKYISQETKNGVETINNYHSFVQVKKSWKN